MRLQEKDIIGVNYEIQRKIGAGSFGQIYLGIIIIIANSNPFFSKKYSYLERGGCEDCKDENDDLILQESSIAKTPQLQNESRIIEALQYEGIRIIKYFNAYRGIYRYPLIWIGKRYKLYDH